MDMGLQLIKINIIPNPKKNQISYSKISSEIINTHKLIINCTPIGTYPNINIAPKIDYNLLTSEHFLFDLIYNPKETNFLKKGKIYGHATTNGKMMFIYQAHQSFTIWNKVMPKIDDETIKLI